LIAWYGFTTKYEPIFKRTIDLIAGRKGGLGGIPPRSPLRRLSAEVLTEAGFLKKSEIFRIPQSGMRRVKDNDCPCPIYLAE